GTTGRGAGATGGCLPGASRAASGRPTPWHPPCSTCTAMSVEIFSTCPQSCDGDAATFARRVAQVAHWSEATLELVPNDRECISREAVAAGQRRGDRAGRRVAEQVRQL